MTETLAPGPRGYDRRLRSASASAGWGRRLRMPMSGARHLRTRQRLPRLPRRASAFYYRLSAPEDGATR
jgi:hypothetical protein